MRRARGGPAWRRGGGWERFPRIGNRQAGQVLGADTDTLGEFAAHQFAEHAPGYAVDRRQQNGAESRTPVRVREVDALTVMLEEVFGEWRGTRHQRAEGFGADALHQAVRILALGEGFLDKADLLSRKVNEFEGQHRFGGGNDGDCDPHVMDILAGKGEDKPEEAQAQYDMLKYECGADGSSVKRATLSVIRK